MERTTKEHTGSFFSALICALCAAFLLTVLLIAAEAAVLTMTPLTEKAMLVFGYLIRMAAVGCGVGGWVMRRKKRQQLEPQPEPQPQPDPEQPCGCPAPSSTVRLTAIGYQGLVHTMDLWEGEPRTLGRTPAANVVLDAADRRLSGVHCSLCCTKGVLTVRDNGSTNGTFVDGVPIRQQGAVPVADGHTLRVGSYEYRVSIQKY